MVHEPVVAEASVLDLLNIERRMPLAGRNTWGQLHPTLSTYSPNESRPRLSRIDLFQGVAAGSQFPTRCPTRVRVLRVRRPTVCRGGAADRDAGGDVILDLRVTVDAARNTRPPIECAATWTAGPPIDL